MFSCTAQERQELIALWQTSFGDERREIEHFFHVFGESGDLLFLKRDEKVVSALYLLPQELAIEGELYQAGYLYAAATAPDCRGAGYMGKLIKRTFDLCKKRGYAACVTLPASDSLYGYYKRFGLEPCVGQRRRQINCKSLLKDSSHPVGWKRGLTYHHYRSVLLKQANVLIKSRETFESVQRYPDLSFFSAKETYVILRGERVVDAAGERSALEEFVRYGMVNDFTSACPELGAPERYGSAKAITGLQQGQLKNLYMTLMME